MSPRVEAAASEEGTGEHLAEVVPLGRVALGPSPAPGFGLPTYVSSFVGRGRELDDVTDLLSLGRLVTLTGAGGMGKTRLAVAVAGQVAPGRAFFIDLASLTEPALVAEEIAAAFGAGELRDRDLAETVAGAVTGDVLLVLDNCEHLVDTCAGLVIRLLRACAGVRILATSQRRLGVEGEAVWLVPGLGVPEGEGVTVADAACDTPAVRLFCERAAAVNRSFVPSPANLEAIIDISRRLDGSPLALELAAARVDVLSPRAIADSLRERLDLLKGQTSTGPARHQTLTAALSWSDNLLEEPERVLLRRLSVFVGGFSQEAAETVCAWGGVGRPQVLDLLADLVARSLVAADTSGAVPRYRLLETVRHYAGQGLAAAKEAAKVGRRHADWCVAMAAVGNAADDESAWVLANQAEEGNLRAALDWSLAKRKAETALHLAKGLMLLLAASGRYGEARDCLARALADGGSDLPALRADALHDLGFASFMVGDNAAALTHIEASLAMWARAGDPSAAERTQGLLAFVSTVGGGPLCVEDLEGDVDRAREAGDDARLAEVLVACGHARAFRGEPLAAARHFEELVAVARRNGDGSMQATGLVGLGAAELGRGDFGSAEEHLGEGVALAVTFAAAHTELVGTAELAELARLRGDHERAGCAFEQCVVRARAVGAPYPLARALLGLGRALLGRGDPAAAQLLFEEAATVAREGGQAHVVPAALGGLGEVALTLQDLPAAQTRFDDALAAARECGDRATVARCTYHLAVVARAQSDLDRAASLHHDALGQRYELGDRAAVADSLEAVAAVSAARGSVEVAARLLAAAASLRTTIGFPRPRRHDAVYDADISLVRKQMAVEDLERVWSEGAAFTAEDALAYASRGRGSRDRPASGLDALTPTQRDVVDLVVEGLTNPEIAERLFVSRRTVQGHLSQAFAKLGVTSRRQLRSSFPSGAQRS